MARKPAEDGGANDGRTDGKGGTTASNGGAASESGRRGDERDGSEGQSAALWNRRSYMGLLGGSAAVVAGLGAAGSAAAQEEFETIEVGPGEQRSFTLGDGDVLENVLIDVTADGADARIRARGDDWVIRNVGFRGKIDVGRHGGFGQTMNCTGNGLIENVYLGDGVGSGADKAAMNTGNSHGGHIEMRNVHIAEFSSNAVYAAGFGRVSGPGQTDGAGGTIAFQNCYFRDNNIAHLRLAADGTVVENCVVHNTNNVPAIPETHGGVEDVVNSRGIYTGYGSPDQEILVQNCDFDITSESTCGEGADHNYCAASVAVSGNHDTYGDLTTVRIVDSEVRGQLVGDNVVTENVGSEPDVTPPETVPLNAEQAASGQAGSGGSGNEGEGDDGTEDDGEGDGQEDGQDSPDLSNTIEVSGGSPDDVVEYRFGVSEAVALGPNANSEDTISDTTVVGALGGGTDDFSFAGEVTHFTATGDVTLVVNGEEVDPAAYDDEGDSGNEDEGDDESPELPRTIELTGGSADETVEYEFEVSEAVAVGSNANPEDGTSGTTAQGALHGGTDDFAFAGEVTEFSATGDVTVTVDGEETDLGPDEDDETTALDRTIAISGGSPDDVVEYEFAVSGAVELGPGANAEDTVSGTVAQGALAGGSDDFAFAGEVTAFSATGDVTVEIDGQSVDPAELGSEDGGDGEDGSDDGGNDEDDGGDEAPEPDRTIAISGGSVDDVVEYQFAVSEVVELGPNANSEDGASETTAHGALAGGTDDFAFAGEVTEFSATGDVTVTVDDEETDLGPDGSDDGEDGGDEPPTPDRTIAISGGSPGDVVEYEFAVSEVVELGPNANAEDGVSGTTASGALAGGTDDFAFAGEVTAFDAGGDVTVEIDGQAVDPTQLG